MVWEVVQIYQKSRKSQLDDLPNLLASTSSGILSSCRIVDISFMVLTSLV